MPKELWPTHSCHPLGGQSLGWLLGRSQGFPVPWGPEESGAFKRRLHFFFFCFCPKEGTAAVTAFHLDLAPSTLGQGWNIWRKNSLLSGSNPTPLLSPCPSSHPNLSHLPSAEPRFITGRPQLTGVPRHTWPLGMCWPVPEPAPPLPHRFPSVFPLAADAQLPPQGSSPVPAGFQREGR